MSNGLSRLLVPALVLGLAGCSGQNSGFMQGSGLFKGLRGNGVRAQVLGTPGATGNGTSAPVETAPVPDSDARSVEEFDTTSPADREAALASAPQGEDGRLGVTVASLGDAAEPGFWIKTPLVSEETSGHVVYAESGRSVQVRLLPSGGAAGSGSQVSLAAMRLLDAPLTGLPELVVYAN